jgi:hypothetical protein
LIYASKDGLQAGDSSHIKMRVTYAGIYLGWEPGSAGKFQPEKHRPRSTLVGGPSFPPDHRSAMFWKVQRLRKLPADQFNKITSLKTIRSGKPHKAITEEPRGPMMVWVEGESVV